MFAPFRQPVSTLLVILVTLLLLSSILPVTGQNEEGYPLERLDNHTSGSWISDSLRPPQVLADPGGSWVSGFDDVDLDMRYRCVNSAGSPPALCYAGGLPPDRQATVHYRVDDGDSTTTTLSNTSTDSPVTLSGAIPESAFSDAINGSSLFFHVDVPLDGVGVPSGGDCDGGEGNPCIDPLHTSGQDEYRLSVDVSDPGFLVGDPANANSRTTGEGEWYLYSNGNLSNFLPTIVISAFDNASGAPLDAGATELSREGEGENTGDYTRTSLGPHTANYEYNYPGGDATSFRDDRVTLLDVLFPDVAGNSIDTHGDDERGIWVVMDITDPEIEISEIDEDEGGSNLTNPPGTLLPVGAGTPVRAHVNVTDIGAHKDADGDNLTDPWPTPAKLLTVEARLFDTNDTTFMTDWVEIPFNETREDDEDVGYFWDNLTIPQEWTSGVTRAEVRVTDPAGNVNQSVIPGNVSVDADLPIIRPQAPVGTGDSGGFSADEDVEFRVRAWHPGDTDPWGESDTDRLGIETILLHSRIGEDGPIREHEMDPEDPEDVFAVARDAYEDDDIVYFYFSAEAISGTTVTYPGPGDPHVTLNATANDGRFLELQMDRIPPELDPAWDLTWVGGPGDHELAFNITDAGIGVDPETATLNWRLSGGGTFEEVALTEETVEDPFTDQTFTAFTGTIPRQSDGDVIEYHVRADDDLGNTGRLGTAAAPRSTTVDLTPPTVTVTSPDVSSENRFNVTWEGQDDQSGVRDFSLQFRVDGGERIGVPDRENTRLTSWEVCAATDRTYEFWVSARDNVGNIRDFPELADASTEVDAPESCAEPPTLTLDAPADGASLSGQVEIRWRAISTVFPEQVSVQIQVGGRTIAEGLEREGSHVWNTAFYDADERSADCFEDGDWDLQVIAVDPASMEAVEEITVSLNNGRDSCDPQPSVLDGPESFEPLYLLVVLAFVGLAAVFAVGMARRW